MTRTIKTDHMNVRSKLRILSVSKRSVLQCVRADEDASSLEGIISHNARYVVLPQRYVWSSKPIAAAEEMGEMQQMEMFEQLNCLVFVLACCTARKFPFLPSLQCFTHFIVCFCKGFHMSCFLTAAVYSGTAAGVGLSQIDVRISFSFKW